MKIYFFSLLLSLGLILGSNPAGAEQTMVDYESFPTFMSNTVKPNVVLVLDNSGSMKIEAYMDKDNAPWWCIWWSDSECVRDNYSGSSSYYGYFESGSMYEYITDDGGYFKEDNISGEWSGHFLNWATMRRVDLARKVLVGGKVGWANRQGAGPYYLLGQNEYADWPVKGFLNDDGLTPAPGNMVVTTDYIPDAECSKLSLSRYAVGGDLEIGRIKVTQSWQTVKFSQTFNSEPVVVAKAFSHACSASVVRINNITTEGFDIRMEEFTSVGCDFFTYGQVTFMAVTPGNHTLGDLYLQAGRVDTDKCSIDPAPLPPEEVEKVTFNEPYFTSIPVVFSSVNSYNEATPVVTRHPFKNQWVFNVIMQEAEGEDNVHATETIGWVAIAKTSGTAGTQDFEVGSISGVTDDLSTINFTSGFHSAPFVLADMQTYTDANTSNLQLRLNNSDYAMIRVQEETTLDAETAHSGEEVGYIAMRMPSYNVKVQVNKEPTGVVQETQDKIRMGLAVYNWDHTRTGNDIYTMPGDEIINGGTLWPGWEWENMDECSSASRAELGLLQNDSLAVENVGGRDICEVPTHVKAPLENIVRTIEEYPQVWATTPTAETLYEVMNYFKQTPTPYFNQTDAKKGAAGAELGGIFDTSEAWDPYDYYDEFEQDEDNRNPSCPKSFVIVISDGQPIRDFTSSGIDTDIIGAITGLGVSSAVSGTQYDYVDDVAWYMHTQDLRPDIDGTQTVSSYTILAAFGDNSESGADIWAETSMKDAAVAGGFEDKNENNEPDPVHPNWSTWTGTSSEWDDDDDKHPDNYYLADDGEELKAKLISTLTKILDEVASGTAASVLSTTGEAKGVIFQAYFKPKDENEEVKWMGYLKGLWIDPWGNIREDSNVNQSLDLKDVGEGTDKLIQFVLQEDETVQVFKYSDGGDGEPDGIRDTCKDHSCNPWKDGCNAGDNECVYEDGGELDDIIPIWEAGQKLADRNLQTDPRVIKTWVDLDDDGERDDDEYIDFSVGNKEELRPFLGVATDAEAEKIINFIRGNAVEGYRNRTVDGKVWKLGDIVNSTPTVVGRPAERMHEYYEDRTYSEFFDVWKDREITVYAGANDGMIHAFNAGQFADGGFSGDGSGCLSDDSADLGKENWAYIPYNLLPHLRWLTDPDYTHVAYVDLKPRVTDARIYDDSNPDYTNGWATIMVAGMGFGGGEITLNDDFDGDGDTEDRTFRSAYFCFDITDPAKPVFLWEKTNDYLGHTTSYPGFVRVAEIKGGNEQGEWFTVFGSGPTAYDGSSDQNARFFILDLMDNANKGTFVNLDAGASPLDVLPEFKSGLSNGFMAYPITVDYPDTHGAQNYSDDFIYVGETYNATGGSAGKGLMRRISTRRDYIPGDQNYKSLDPENWEMCILSDSFQPKLWGPWEDIPPITTAANASWDGEDVFVYFGTGKNFNAVDKTDDSMQYFFGVIEKYMKLSEADDKNGCSADTKSNVWSWGNVSSYEITTEGDIVDDASITFETIEGYVKSLHGWFMALDYDKDGIGGERLLTRPSVLGGTVLFTTFTPDSDVCNFGGNSYLYALYYKTGTAYKKDIIGTKDGKNVKAIDLGKGQAADVGIHMSNAGRQQKGTGIIQQSSGVINQLDIVPALRVKSGIFSWNQ